MLEKCGSLCGHFKWKIIKCFAEEESGVWRSWSALCFVHSICCQDFNPDTASKIHTWKCVEPSVTVWDYNPMRILRQESSAYRFNTAAVLFGLFYFSLTKSYIHLLSVVNTQYWHILVLICSRQWYPTDVLFCNL